MSISTENYAKLKKQAQERIAAVIDFIKDSNTCRNRKILQYFNEESFTDCGTCDVCMRKDKHSKGPTFSQIKVQLHMLLEHKTYLLDELTSLMYHYSKEDVIDCINQLADDKEILINKKQEVSKL